MKKITLILALLALVSFSSCRKNRTCTCVTTNSGVINAKTSQDHILENVNKTEGEEECDKLDSEWTQSGLTTTVACSLQ